MNVIHMREWVCLKTRSFTILDIRKCPYQHDQVFLHCSQVELDIIISYNVSTFAVMRSNVLSPFWATRHLHNILEYLEFMIQVYQKEEITFDCCIFKPIYIGKFMSQRRLYFIRKPKTILLDLPLFKIVLPTFWPFETKEIHLWHKLTKCTPTAPKKTLTKS